MSFNTIQIPSLCLPRVYYKFDESYIEQVFNAVFCSTNEYSVIESIDMVSRIDNKTEEPFYLVFVHFKNNVYSNESVEYFVNCIERGDEVKVLYNKPWYWKVRKNNSVLKDDPPKKPKNVNAPRMVFDEEEANKMKEITKQMNEDMSVSDEEMNMIE